MCHQIVIKTGDGICFSDEFKLFSLSYINAYMWNEEKNGIDDLICKAETETQTWRANIRTPRGGGGGRNREIGLTRMPVDPESEQTAVASPLSSTDSPAQRALLP